MAHTRGISKNYDNGGVLLGKDGAPLPVSPFVSKATQTEPPKLDRQGNYVSPAAALLNAPRRLSGGTVMHGPGAEPVPEMPQIVRYRAEPKTWSKNMEAHELARLIDMLLKQPAGMLGAGLVVDVSPEEWATMDGNLRRHFMPMREYI